jgi:hypothetical protein
MWDGQALHIVGHMTLLEVFTLHMYMSPCRRWRQVTTGNSFF